jgi:phosphomannomutase
MNILKFAKKNLKKFPFTKATAIFTSLCFIVSVVFSQAAYAVMPTTIPVASTLNNVPKTLIPFNLGKITDAYYAGTGDIVINIQDLHSHEQTQRNISSILSILDNKFGITDIYLEGASGTLDTKWLSNIEDDSVKQKVLNTLLANGRLTGGEYFAVQTGKNDILKGLEDRNVYSENTKRLNEIYNKNVEVKNYISILTSVFNERSKQYYSAENKKINRIVDSYRDGTIKTEKYIERILKKAQKTDIDLSKYKSIVNFAQIISKQKSFNSNRLNNEIKELLAELKEKLSFAEYNSLIEKATKKEYEVEFYFNLLNKAKELNILSARKYKNTELFLEYLILNQNINTVELANEEKLFIQELKNKFAATQAEKDIYFIQDNLESLSHYLTNKMTAKEHEQFTRNKDKFQLLWKQYIDIDNLTNLDQYLNLVDDFYNNNIERNRIFIKNIFGKNTKGYINGLRIKNSKINHNEKILEDLSNNKITKNKKVHVVITGGFHTYGFNKILEDEKINYVVITPNVTEDTTKAENLYKNIFNEQYDITNTTFANRPVSEVIELLNKGEIKSVKVVNDVVEIEFPKETYSLKNIKVEEISPETETLSEEQAGIAAELVVNIQEILKEIRNNNRAGTSINIFSKLNYLEQLNSRITDTQIKQFFTGQINKIRDDNPDMVEDTTGKLMLPSTRKFLNILFGFIKNREIKNRLMSIAAAVLENTFLFPWILFSPETFVLMHYKKGTRQRIKSKLYDLEKLYIKEELSQNDLDDTDLEEIKKIELFLEKIGYTQRLEGTLEMREKGFAGMILVGIIFLASVAGTIETTETFTEAFSAITSSILYFLYAFAGVLGLELHFSHIKHNLKVDLNRSKLKKSVTDLVNIFPNDVSYQNLQDLEKSNLYLVFSDILEIFKKDFFARGYLETTGNIYSPLTILEVLKGSLERGGEKNPEEYDYNIETIVDYFKRMSEEQTNIIIDNIDATLYNNYLSKEERNLLKQYKKNLINFKRNRWKLSIAEARDEKTTKIRDDNPDIFEDTTDKLMLPSTKRFLNILFGFIKKENVKNKIMSVGAAILENTFLFPIILFSPTTFTLLHFKKNSRKNIKKVLNELDELNNIKNLLVELDTLSKQGQEQTQTYKEQLQNLSRQVGRINKNIKNLNTEELNREIQKRENFLNKIGYTPILNGTLNMKKRGFGFMIFAGVMMFISFMGTIETTRTFAEAFSMLGNNIQYIFYTLAGAFGFGFYEAHIAHNLKIDFKVSKAKQALKNSLYDLVELLPNDVTYADYENLEESELFVIFSDILEAFDYDFFDRDYIKSTDGEAEPLTFLEILKGITARGEGIDFEEFDYNIETIIDFFETMSDEQKNTIIENIDAILQNNSLSKDEKELLKNYRNNILSFKKKYWKLSLADSKDKETTDRYVMKFGDQTYVTTATSYSQAFKNLVFQIAERDKTIERKNLKIYKIHEAIGYNAYRKDLDIRIARSNRTRKEKEAYEQAELEKFYKRFITKIESTTYAKRTNKSLTKQQRKGNEDIFYINVEGLNDTPELSAFQTVYASSSGQAVWALAYQLCMATERGELVGGRYKDLTFSKENVKRIEEAILKKYNGNISIIVKDKKGDAVKENVAPILNTSSPKKQKGKRIKAEGQKYQVKIPDFNDGEGFEPYQTVYATSKKDAVYQAVEQIIKAKESGELIEGYYNYRKIYRRNSQKIIDSILSKYKGNTIDSIVTLLEEPVKDNKTDSIVKLSEPEYEQLSLDLESLLTTPSEPVRATTKPVTPIIEQSIPDLQTLISQLTNSQNDIELKAAIESMIKAGFKEDYIENLLYQYLTLRNGNIPQEIYTKTAPIKFGTAGVRGIMGEEVDFLDIVIITQAISNVMQSIANKQNIDTKDIKVFVGGDSRFLSKQFAEIVSKTLAANDINVVISKDDIPSPTISYYTRTNGFTLSINITASHNPKEHNGYKITLGDGGQAGLDVTTMIENEINNIQNNLLSNAAHGINIVKNSEKIKSIDAKDKFIDAFEKMISKIFAIDKDSSLNKFKQKAAKWTVVVDPKNGATKKYYYEILKFFGFNIVMINDTVDPTFGGQKPEPSFENTKQLREKVKSISEDNLLGISTDVDGDRFAVVDKDGNFITANNIGTILLNFRLQTLFDNLISDLNAANGNKEQQNKILKDFIIKKDANGQESVRKIIIPRNCATTHVLDDLASDITATYYEKLKAFGLDSELLEQFKNCVEVKEVNVGFKFFAQAKHNAENNGDLFLLGVESSGGISVAEWIYDKCGFLANLMLLFVLVENDKQPKDILSDIYSRINYEPQVLETAISFREIVEKEGKLKTPELISAEAKKRQEKLMAIVTQLKQNEKLVVIKNMFVRIDKGLVIKEIRDTDGIKILFENGAWLLIRPSGTEPLVRVFTESKKKTNVSEEEQDLSKAIAAFVTENGGQTLIDTIEKDLQLKETPFKANAALFKIIIENSIKSLQRLTYSVLFKDNVEYTMVANATDFERRSEAKKLSEKGIKVNLILLGETSLSQETNSRISTENGDLAFCLIDKPIENLTVYGYDDKTYGQNVDISNIDKQSGLIGMLNYVNDNSDRNIKLLDLPENLSRDIATADVEDFAKEKFSIVGVGKKVLDLFVDVLANKLNRKSGNNMIIQPSVVATNLSAEQIDTFGQNDISKLVNQGVTTIIVSANDQLMYDKSQTLKNLLQMAHDNGLKVMFNYNFNLKNMTIDDFSNWISSFNDKFQQFNENGGIDGFQADLSQSETLANNSTVLSLLSSLSKVIKEQNTGSFLSIKMPDNLYPTEFLILCNNEDIKLVVDYNSQLLPTGLSNLKNDNMIINISADKNGNISIEDLSGMFKNNNSVSMLSLDFPILEAIGDNEDFTFNDKQMTIVKFITSLFETTPEGQKIKGINKGRNFVLNRDSVIEEDILNTLYTMYINDNCDINQINAMLQPNFKENISKYELNGFVEGVLQATELKKQNALDISFDKKEYTNLLMKTLLDYRIDNGISFNKDLSSDIEKILIIDNFRKEFEQEIKKVFYTLNDTGTVKGKEYIAIDGLSSLLKEKKDKDNNSQFPKLNSQERAMVLEGILLLLLGYARQDTIGIIGTAVNTDNIANIKALLSAA